MNLKNQMALLGLTAMLALAMTPTATARSDFLDDVEAPDYGALPHTPDTPDTSITDLTLNSIDADLCIGVLETDGYCGDANHNTYLASLKVGVEAASRSYEQCVLTSTVNPTEYCE